MTAKVFTVNGESLDHVELDGKDVEATQNGTQGTYKSVSDGSGKTAGDGHDTDPVRLTIVDTNVVQNVGINISPHGKGDLSSEDTQDVTDTKKCLIYTTREDITQKDFTKEVRAMRDVAAYLDKTPFILDLDESRVEDIFRHMLKDMLEKDESLAAIEDAYDVLFTRDDVHQMTRIIHASCEAAGGGQEDEQSWICVLCSVASVKTRHVGIARLKRPENLGPSSEEVQFVILIVAPIKEKGTKNALETGRTFSTLFADVDLRLDLLSAGDAAQFKEILLKHAEAVTKRDMRILKEGDLLIKQELKEEKTEKDCGLCCGLISDFTRRLKFYPSDYKDSFVGAKAIQKTISTTFFLYFACLLPCIALGELNSKNTDGELNVKKVIYGQTIGGLFFALFGGQPMVILLTTAPLALYTRVIYTLCEEWNLNFPAMYAAVGLWNSFFVILYSVTGASRLMKWSTRSTEEIFALFISIAFTVDATKGCVKDFSYHYEPCEDAPSNVSVSPLLATTMATINDTRLVESEYSCARDTSMLFLFLMLTTAWLGLSIFRCTKTPFLNAGKREILADYALPISVLIMAFVGSYLFRAIKMKPFSYSDGQVFKIAPLTELTWPGILGAMGLGFSLSLLFFMDQNISGAMVNTRENKLKKGPAYHWDLLIVAVLNGALTIFGLPMMHGALPHSPLHARAMADTEDRVDQGHIYQRVVLARETRVTGVLCHVLIGLSIFLLQYPLAYIPPPVLNGLFLYLAVTALDNNQMFERTMLLFTEQTSYPPNHYIRQVPQRMIHLFTLTQLIQLGVMCALGFSPMPYLKMGFPVLLLLLLPIRNGLIPRFIPRRYLKAIDGH